MRLKNSLLITVTLLIICLVTLITVISLQYSSAPTPPLQDPYSENCPKGEYAIFDNASNYQCATLHACNSSADCAYLTINKLPPRYGTCINKKCSATCGSGIARKCVH